MQSHFVTVRGEIGYLLDGSHYVNVDEYNDADKEQQEEMFQF
jgi:hypothetical protein